jgi:hypothetical protein
VPPARPPAAARGPAAASVVGSPCLVTMRGRSSAVLLAAGAAALLVSSLAAGRIAPQRGIMGIHLKMPGTLVVQKKGKPDAEHVIRQEILGHQRILRYGKTRVGLSGPKRSDTVVAVSTTDPRQRTRSGVGVGSRQRAVKSRIKGITCETVAGSRLCSKGSPEPGHRVTLFNISSTHRVTRVTVGFVID